MNLSTRTSGTTSMSISSRIGASIRSSALPTTCPPNRSPFYTFMNKREGNNNKFILIHIESSIIYDGWPLMCFGLYWHYD